MVIKNHIIKMNDLPNFNEDDIIDLVVYVTRVRKKKLYLPKSAIKKKGRYKDTIEIIELMEEENEIYDSHIS